MIGGDTLTSNFFPKGLVFHLDLGAARRALSEQAAQLQASPRATPALQLMALQSSPT
jgi:hypothetical protein